MPLGLPVLYVLSGAGLPLFDDLDEACYGGSSVQLPFSSPPTTNSSLIPPLFPLSPEIAHLPGVSQPSYKFRDFSFACLATSSLPVKEAFFKSSTKGILLADSGIELRVQCRRTKVSQGSVLFRLLGLPLPFQCT